MGDGAVWRIQGTGELVRTGEEAVAIVRASIDAGSLDVWFEHPADKSLSLTTNRCRAMLILWGRTGLDEGVMAVDREAGDGEQGDYVLANGQHDSYPNAHTVPLHDAINAIRYIIDHNAIDPTLQWDTWT